MKEIDREQYGNDHRAINRHSVRTYQDEQGNLWKLSRTTDALPPFFEAYGPYRPGLQGIVPRFKVDGLEYWGDGWPWTRAVKVFFAAVAARKEQT